MKNYGTKVIVLARSDKFSDLEEDSDKEQSDSDSEVDESALQVEQSVTTNPSSRETKAPPLVWTPNL